MGKNEMYYFSDIEISFMLSVAGRTNWCGINHIDDYMDFNKKEIVYSIIVSLFKKEVIEVSKNKITFLPPFTKMMQVFKNCKFSFQSLKNGNLEECINFFVWNNTVVLFKRSNMESDFIKVSIMEMDEWIQYLKENGYFPHIIDSSFEKQTNPVLCKLRRDVQLEELVESEEIISLFEKYDVETELLMSRIIVEDCILLARIYIQSEEETNTFLLKDEENEFVIIDWMRGENG